LDEGKSAKMNMSQAAVKGLVFKKSLFKSSAENYLKGWLEEVSKFTDASTNFLITVSIRTRNYSKKV